MTRALTPLTPHNSHFNGSRWPKWARNAVFDWSRAVVDQGPSPAGNPGPYYKVPYVSGPDKATTDLMAGTWHRIYPKASKK